MPARFSLLLSSVCSLLGLVPFRTCVAFRVCAQMRSFVCLFFAWPGIMASADVPDVDEELLALAIQCKVPEAYHQCLSGFDVPLFGCLAASATDFAPALDTLLEKVSAPESAAEILLVQASFRLLFQKCNTQAAPSQGTEPKAPSSASNSGWVEQFPPKLSGEQVIQLRSAFGASYPGEVLDHENTPGSRMLALTSKVMQPGELKWIPWKFRMSKVQEEAFNLRRPSKVPKFEDFIYDEIPARELPQGQVGASFLQGVLGLMSVSASLVQGAHLHNLRLYERKFIKLACSRLEGSTGLRQPNIEELQAADRHLWGIMADLVNVHKWTLNDALTEVVEIRGDMSAMLQPRAAVSKFRPEGRKGDGKKGRPPRESSSGKGGKGQRWVLSYQDKSGARKNLCRGYSSREGCKFENCRFEHLCPVPGADGRPCLGKHPAYEHKSRASN